MTSTVLFFARDYQSRFFPALISTQYKSVYATLNKKEKQIVIENGGENVICFEEEFDSLPINDINVYLKYSYGCDRSYVGLNLNQREYILKKSISFWSKVMEEYKPDLIINETVAIEISEVLANEAKKRKIKYRSWMSFTKKNTFYWQASPFHTSLKTILGEVTPTNENIEEANIFIDGLRAGTEKPFYVQNTTNRYSLLRLAKNIWSLLLEIPLKLRFSKVKRTVFYGTTETLKLRNIKLFFLSLFSSSGNYDSIDNNTDKELVLYPMHFEPEAVLFYMAYFYDNQATVIENVLKCLDVNQILVVKEHPQQAGTLLEGQYKKIKKRYPNLIFIRAEEPTIKILKAADVVITLGSTAGFEALALGKKIINLSRVFFDSFEGVNNCKSYAEVYDLLRGNTPFNAPIGFNLFVAKMIKYVKPGNPFYHAQLLSDDNVNAIRKAIEDELIIKD
jgi:hypothetical protein